MKSYETIKIAPSQFFEYIRNDIVTVKLTDDNPPYTGRMRGVDNKAIKKVQIACNNAKNTLVEQFPNNSDEIEANYNKLLSILRSEKSTVKYTEPILNYMCFYDSTIERIGYITYAKDYMTYYDMSTKLVDILSILSGTDPVIIKCFLKNHLAHIGRDMTVEDFSRKYLGSYNIPVGYTHELISCMPPAVRNILINIMTIGEETNFAIRGSNKISIMNFCSDYNGWHIINSNGNTLSYEDNMDIYVCYVLRFLTYYIFSEVYKTIKLKYVPLWTEANKARKSLSELLVAWTATDIVFQNGKNRIFPTFKFTGRGESSMILKPNTYSTDEFAVACISGNLAFTER